jgi:hypothetical protein
MDAWNGQPGGPDGHTAGATLRELLGFLRWLVQVHGGTVDTGSSLGPRGLGRPAGVWTQVAGKGVDRWPRT